MIDPKKVYTTRDGREVRIYAVGVGKLQPIHGAIKIAEGHWEMGEWGEDGKWLSYSIHGNDLIESRPKHEGWVNVYKDSRLATGFHVGCAYPTKQKAQAASNIAIARLHLQFTEGDGLE